MDYISQLFLKFSYIVTAIFFVITVILFISLIVINSRVWKHYKRRD